MMNITKDEARILAEMVKDGKYNFVDSLRKSVPERIILFHALENLEEKLEKGGIDARRTGRTSEDSFSDLIVRFTETYEKEKNQ